MIKQTNMVKNENDLRSKCCNATFYIRESGVSQLSWDEFYHCSKCDKKGDVQRVFENKQMFFKLL